MAKSPQTLKSPYPLSAWVARTRDGARRAQSRMRTRINDKPVLAAGLSAAAWAGRRLFRWGGEAVAIVIALAILLFFIASQILDRQQVDLSLIRPNVALWFSQAFEGAGADIEHIELQWLPMRGAVRFSALNVTIYDRNGVNIQALPQLHATAPIEDLLAGRTRFDDVDIVGGEVTWLQTEDGQVTAGLGRPNTVGGFGPIYTGQSEDAEASRLDWANMFGALRLRDSTAYIVNEMNGLSVKLSVDEMRVWRETEVHSKNDLRLSFQGAILNNEADAGSVDVHARFDENFERIEVDLAANQLRPDVLSPKSGRFVGLSGIKLAVDAGLSVDYSRTEGLQSAFLDVSSGAGTVALAGQNHDVSVLSFQGRLDPGEQVMRVARLSLEADILSFESSGVIRDVGRLYDGNVGTSPRFDLTLNNVGFDATPILEGPLSLERAQILGEIDVDTRRLTIEDLRADFGDFAIQTTAEAQTRENGLARLKLDGVTVTPMNAKDLLSVWPVDFADGARRWIENSVKGGTLDHIDFQVDLDPEFFDEPALTPERLQLGFQVSGGFVKYISTMTPLTDANAVGQIDGNSMSLTLEKGTIGSVAITSGTVSIPVLMPHGGDIIMTANASAATQDLLSLINQPPFRYLDRYGVSPDGFGGQGDVVLTVKRPLLEYFDQNRIEYSVAGELMQASAPFRIGDFGITNADLTIKGGKEGLFLSGPADVGPWRAHVDWAERYGQNGEPTRYTIAGVMDRTALDGFGIGGRGMFGGELGVVLEAEGKGLQIEKGQLNVDLEEAELSLGELWQKPIGDPGALAAELTLSETGLALDHLSATAPGLIIKGDAHLRKDMGLIEARLTEISIADFIDGALTLDRDVNATRMRASDDESDGESDDQSGSDRLRLSASGSLLNMSAFVERFLTTRSTNGSFPLSAQANFDQLILAENYGLSAAEFKYDYDGSAIQSATLRGQRPAGTLEAGLRADENGLNRQINLSVPDLSPASRSLLGVGATRGGRLTLEADLPATESAGPIIGSVYMTEFSVDDAPFLAQILSLASFTGLLDTLSGEGLAFDILELDFSLREGSLAFRNARMHGPAIGMTGEGDINLANKSVDVNGTLVPSYTANSLLADIPVLGGLLTGGEGEGIFAVTYSVRGPYSGAQIAINPLSALTPGFLRGIFGTEREALPEMPVDQPSAEAEE